MKRVIKDGWHTIQGFSVYVENGIVKRGLIGSADYKTFYPYRWHKTYNSWIIETNLSVDAFRAGVKRGTITMI